MSVKLKKKVKDIFKLNRTRQIEKLPFILRTQRPILFNIPQGDYSFPSIIGFPNQLLKELE